MGSLPFDKSVLKEDVRLSPWMFFWIFLLSHSIISYTTLPLAIKFWIGTAGLLLPLITALWMAFEARHSKTLALSRDLPGFFHQITIEAGPPVWLWIFFLVALVLTHFYKLVSFPTGPIGDEGAFSMIAIDLQRHWSWRLLLGPNQWEPLFAWMLSCFFRILTPSLTTIRIFPNLISLLTVLASYWALRPLGNRWFAFAVAWATAFDFWSFTYSRLCVREGLLLPWEFVVLGLLARIWLGEKCDYRQILFLSLVLGTGFYVFTSWPLVVLAAGAITAIKIKEYPTARERWVSFSVLFFLTASLAFPMLTERFNDAGSSHIRNLFYPPDFFTQAGKYIVSLFWFGFHSTPWGPDWGGFFNPVLGSLILLGFVEMARWASKFLMILMFSGFVFFFFRAP